MAKNSPQDSPPSVHDLVPLDLATRLVFRRVYEDRGLAAEPMRSGRHLDGLACVIATMVPLYTYEVNGPEIRTLDKTLIDGGLFRGGGKALYFVDGRKEITQIAVSTDTIAQVVSAMLDATPKVEKLDRYAPQRSEGERS